MPIVVLELVPDAADNEGLDGYLSRLEVSADAQTQTTAHARSVVEVHSVGALREVVDLAVDHADRGQRLEEHAGPEAAEAITGIESHAEILGVERACKADRALGIEVDEIGLKQRVEEEAAIEIGRVGANLTTVEIEALGELIVVELRNDEAAEHAEDQRIALAEEVTHAEVGANLEVSGALFAIEVGRGRSETREADARVSVQLAERAARPKPRRDRLIARGRSDRLEF